MENNIKYKHLEPKKSYKLKKPANILLPVANQGHIIKSLLNFKKSESNADVLSQSFGTPPEITPIPSSQSADLEKQPASLDINAVSNPSVPAFDQPIIDNGIKNDIISTDRVINEVSQVDTPVIDSVFKVSDSPNIFNNIPENNMVDNSNNIFNQPIDDKKEEIKIDNVLEKTTDDLVAKEIYLLEQEIKNTEERVKIKREQLEYLKNKYKKVEKNDVLENTASKLFNNNGVLDEEQVLGDTPMLKAA